MKPILFNTPMTRAILEGRKRVTRRIVKCQPMPATETEPPCQIKLAKEGRFKGEWHLFRDDPLLDPAKQSPWGMQYTPPYQPDDILYVRETWKQATGDTAGGGYGLFDTYVYKADGKAKDDYPLDRLMVEGKWHPSIHMPKKAARIFLLVTDVRAEQLQEITEEQAKSEGAVAPFLYDEGWKKEIGTARDSFIGIWDSTVTPEDREKYGWEANPWVWVIEFRRISKEEALG